jgi:hypothetical protein
MRAPYLIRLSKVLSSQLLLAGLVLPIQLFAQSVERAVQYKVGDVARETVIATETIRVSSVSTTETSYSNSSSEIPALYAYQKTVSDSIEQRLTNDWNAARDNYLVALERVFGKRTFRTTEITSEAFVHFTDEFQASNRGFPFNDAAANRWAAGSMHDNDLQRYLGSIRNFMSSYFIRPNNDPFANGKTDAEVEVTTVGSTLPTRLSDTLTESLVRVPLNQFLTLAQARAMYESQGTGGNRALTQYLSQSIQANTSFLQEVSQERWSNTSSPIKKEYIFESGDVIVREGEIVTQVVKEALDVMAVNLRFNRLRDSVKIELAKEPRNAPEEPIQQEAPARAPPEIKLEPKETTRERPQGKLPPILSPTTVAQTEEPKPEPEPKEDLTIAPMVASSPAVSSFTRWIIGFILIAIVAFLVMLHFKRGPPMYLSEEEPLAVVEDRKQSLVKALTSQLTQTLFRQRQELIRSKEEATAQVAAMESRLAKLQPEILAKLAAYEKKIKDLENQLRQQGVSKEMMNQNVSDDVARPIFEELKSSVEGEENFETKQDQTIVAEDDKEVPFPGHAVVDDIDEDGPRDLMEEVLEDLEAEDNFDNRIAKGSDR